MGELYKVQKTENVQKKKPNKKRNKKKPIVDRIKGKVLNGPSDGHINPTLVKNISNMSLRTENQLDDFISKKIPTSPSQEGKKKNKKRQQVNGSPVDHSKNQIQAITEKRPLSPEEEAKKKKK